MYGRESLSIEKVHADLSSNKPNEKFEVNTFNVGDGIVIEKSLDANPSPRL